MSLFSCDRDTLFTLEFIEPVSVVVDPIIVIMSVASTYITIVLSVDRALAVTLPLKWKTHCNRTLVKSVLAAVAVSTVLFHIPLFLERTWEDIFIPSLNSTYTLSAPTEYGMSHFHEDVYLKYILPAVTGFIPILLIVVPNSLIISKVISRQRQDLGSSGHTEAKKAEANRLTGQVLAISVLTLIGRVFYAAGYVMMTSHDTMYVTACTLSCGVVVAMTQVFVKVSSASNFIFYCYFGQKFRQVLLSKFPWLRCVVIATPAERSGVKARSDVEVKQREELKKVSETGHDVMSNARAENTDVSHVDMATGKSGQNGGKSEGNMERPEKDMEGSGESFSKNDNCKENKDVRNDMAEECGCSNSMYIDVNAIDFTEEDHKNKNTQMDHGLN